LTSGEMPSIFDFVSGDLRRLLAPLYKCAKAPEEVIFSRALSHGFFALRGCLMGSDVEGKAKKEVAPGLWEYQFGSLEEIEKFFIESWKEKKFKGMSTKIIGHKLFAWQKKI